MRGLSDSLQAPRQYSDYEFSSASEWESDMENERARSPSPVDHQDEDARHAMPESSTQLSSSFYVSTAARIMENLKKTVKDDGSWKKALKHKSGVMVYIRQSADPSDKIAIFKGDGIIRGYTPQSIFHVIGIRKLWDESFVEGCLLENLNDTTSITYEVIKPPSSSKPSDLCLVEKIECTSDGVIYFACASVDHPKKPKSSSKNRSNLKTTPPCTKVTYVIQEGNRGWIQGFTKKSMARKPLAIASVDKYLQEKADRMFPQNQISRSASTGAQNSGTRRPSLMDNNRAASQPLPIRTTSLGLPSISPPSLTQPRNQASNYFPHNQSSDSISTASSILRNSNSSTPNTSVASSPSLKRRIRFADHTDTQDMSSNSVPTLPPNDTISSILVKRNKSTDSVQSQNLYPSHRHLEAKHKCLSMLKLLSSNHISDWTSVGGQSSKVYLKTIEGFAMPLLRTERIVTTGWTVEQLCTVVQNFEARKIWDSEFVEGRLVERFSQKDYLVHTKLRLDEAGQTVDFALLSLIDSEPASGIVYHVYTSVEDRMIPPKDDCTRGHVFVEGWVFEPSFDKMGRTRSVSVTFISHMDFRQPSLQKESIQKHLVQRAEKIFHIEQFLQTRGCPPYIRRVAGKVSKETFHSGNKSYGVAFIVKHQSSLPNEGSNWCTDVRIHASMYPNGFRIHSNPQKGIRIELRSDSAGIRIYSTSPDMDGSVLTINIMPQKEDIGSSRARITCNNVPLLIGSSYHPGTEISRSLSVTSNASSQSTDSQYQDAKADIVSQLEHKSAPASNNQPDSPTRSESSGTVSSRDTPPPSYSNSMIATKSENEENNKIQETEESMPGSLLKSMDDDVFSNIEFQSNIENSGKVDAREERRRGSLASVFSSSEKVLIINDELQFNRQQLVVIILAMAICYYTGKFSCKC
ncbi:hypothetical protein VKS41_007584 [Umbelopsis sp. WA50703]